jgi:hypothetical protein
LDNNDKFLLCSLCLKTLESTDIRCIAADKFCEIRGKVGLLQIKRTLCSVGQLNQRGYDESRIDLEWERQESCRLLNVGEETRCRSVSSQLMEDI